MTQINAHGQPVGDEVVGWSPRPWPESARLEGRYVRLAPLTSASYADLYAATCGPEDERLWTYRPAERPTSLAGLWMHLAAAVDSATELPYAIVPAEGPRAGKATGLASYLRIEPAHGSIEIGGILFGRDLQRTRAATEAIHLMMAYAFDDLGYRRIEWKCDSLNEPSRRAARRLGFRHEGRFRSHLVLKGRNRDTDWFSVTAQEWPGVCAAHRRWLDPTNFDAEDRQRSSLSGLTAQERG